MALAFIMLARHCFNWPSQGVWAAILSMGLAPFFARPFRPETFDLVVISVTGAFGIVLVCTWTRFAVHASLGFKPDEAYAPFRARPKPKVWWQFLFPQPTETKRYPALVDLILPRLAVVIVLLSLNLAFPFIEQTLPRTHRLAILGPVFLCNLVVVYQLWELASTFRYSFSRKSSATALADHRLQHVCKQYRDCDETNLNQAIQVTEELYGNEFDRLHLMLCRFAKLEESDPETLLQEAKAESKLLGSQPALDSQDNLLLDYDTFVQVALDKYGHARFQNRPQCDLGPATPAPSSILISLYTHLVDFGYSRGKDESGKIFREQLGKVVKSMGEPTWLERKCLALFDRNASATDQAPQPNA